MTLIMPRLSVAPTFTSTAVSDIIIGEEFNSSVAVGIDILTGGIIDTLEGDDSITGTSTGTGSDSGFGFSGAGNGTGIRNTGQLITGDGEDKIMF